MNKTGPHGLYPTSGALLWARNALIVKQAGGIELLQVAPPGAITIARPLVPVPDEIKWDGAATAQAALDALGGFRPTAVELWNEGDEIGQRLGKGLEERLRVTREAVPVLRAAGTELAGYSFSTGVPDAQDWRYLQDNDFGGVIYIAIHEYWGNQGFTTWNTLRYRRVDGWLGGDHPPFIITECGRGTVEGGGDGWKQSVSAQQYITELEAYDAKISEDFYIIGGTVFTVGANCSGPPTACWDWYDVDELVPAILGIGPPPPPPPPPGAPGINPLLILAGAVIGGVAVGLLATELVGVEAEVVVRPPGRPPIRRRVIGPPTIEAEEWPADQPIPVGYRVVG